MTLQLTKLIAWFVVVLVAQKGTSVPVPVLDVPSLTQQSELVVVGKVESVRDLGPTTADIQGRSVAAHIIVCQMDVSGVLKGVASSKLSIRYVLPDEPVGYGSVAASSYQIVFLRKDDGEYAFANPYHASLPAVPGTLVEAGDVLSNITRQLGAVVQSTATLSDQKQLALYALSTIRTPQSTTLLREALKQKDSALRLNAAGFLLLRNDVSGLNLAEASLLRPEGDVPRYILHNVAYGISEGVRDQNAVPSLSRLLRAQDIETRRAAASALRHTGSRSALEPLAHALGDGDFEVRYEAVIGLGEITGQSDWGPGMDVFQSEESKYLEHWREWALTNGLLQ